MKKLYFSLSILFAASQVSMAQLTLTKVNNEPVVGDVQIEIAYDSTTSVPKNTGAGQNWNFTTFTLGTSSYTETTTFTTTSSVPSSSIAPAATIVGDKGSGKYDFLRSSGSNYEYVGQYDPSGPNYFVFSNTGILYTWPISMGNTISDSFSGVVTSPSGTMTISGTVTHSATVTGTVTLPSGNKHTNCLQYTENVMFTIMQGTTTVQTQNEFKYMYFSSSMKFPIAELHYRTQTSGTVTTKSTDLLFSKDALAAGINEHTSVNNNFNVYPNPACDLVNVVLPNNATVSSIEIIDIAGKIVASNLNSNSINVSVLAKAVYTIRVKSKDVVLQKQLVIAE